MFVCLFCKRTSIMSSMSVSMSLSMTFTYTNDNKEQKVKFWGQLKLLSTFILLLLLHVFKNKTKKISCQMKTLRSLKSLTLTKLCFTLFFAFNVLFSD